MELGIAIPLAIRMPPSIPLAAAAAPAANRPKAEHCFVKASIGIQNSQAPLSLYSSSFFKLTQAEAEEEKEDWHSRH